MRLRTLALLLFLTGTGTLISHARRAMAEAEPMVLESDLRPEFSRLGLDLRKQGERPTCSVFAMVNALQFTLAKEHRQSEPLSVEFLNWAANNTGKSREDGGYFTDLWRGFEEYGVCKESLMPYGTKSKPPKEAIEDGKEMRKYGFALSWIKRWNPNTGLRPDQIEAVQRTLASGRPVMIGMRWPIKPTYVDGVMQMCHVSDVQDGHSVLLIGYVAKGGYYLVRDSGTGKDIKLSQALIHRYVNDAAYIQS